MSFKEIADVYNRFNDNGVYENWLDFTLSQLEMRPSKVLDLACGTGVFARMLSPLVGKMEGLDLDESMLEVARQSNGDKDIEYFQGNMLALTFLEADYDLITCFADSLCFLADFEQVERAVGQVFNQLVNGGKFIFDVWTVHQILNGFDNFTYTDSDDEASLIWESFVDKDEISVTHELTVFQRQTNSNLFAKIECDLFERTYPIVQFEKLLKSVGFSGIKLYIEFGQKELTEFEEVETDRWFVVCQK